MQKENNSETSPKKGFLLDIARGVGIGTAFIIPGFSGGSVAAILGIYERLVNAIADIFGNFKKSFLTLLPIFIGMAIGICALIYPLSYTLSAFPLPTVALVVGLAIGGIPSVTDNMRGGVKPSGVIALSAALLLALSLSFLPIGNEVDLFSLDFVGYLLLFGVGIIGSAALVIPGISGSMLLFIFGYYNPILRVATEHLFLGRDILTSLGILLTVGGGIVVGFIGISVVMKRLLIKYKRTTYFAICGFILGSLPSVFISAGKDAGYTVSTLPDSPLHWVAVALLFAVGFAVSFILVRLVKRSAREKE